MFGLLWHLASIKRRSISLYSSSLVSTLRASTLGPQCPPHKPLLNQPQLNTPQLRQPQLNRPQHTSTKSTSAPQTATQQTSTLQTSTQRTSTPLTLTQQTSTSWQFHFVQPVNLDSDVSALNSIFGLLWHTAMTARRPASLRSFSLVSTTRASNLDPHFLPSRSQRFTQISDSSHSFLISVLLCHHHPVCRGPADDERSECPFFHTLPKLTFPVDYSQNPLAPTNFFSKWRAL